MGLLSGLTGAQKTKVPASGFYTQPEAYQGVYHNLLDTLGPLISKPNTDAFTPLAQTADETAAFDAIRAGLAPTPESLSKDISMFMNPFDEYVTAGINREAQGANSLVNQYATQAGQQGSNRSFLGTSDVEQNRLNNIGQFRQSNYNNAINNILGPLSTLRQQDIQNLLGIGGFERGLNAQTKQAPYADANARLGLFNQIPTEFGNFGTKEQTIKTGGGLGGVLSLAGNVASIATGNPLWAMGANALSGQGGGNPLGALASFSGNSGLGLGQQVGSLFSSSSMGPYKNYGGFFG